MIANAAGPVRSPICLHAGFKFEFMAWAWFFFAVNRSKCHSAPLWPISGTHVESLYKLLWSRGFCRALVARMINQFVFEQMIIPAVGAL
jgi:hypothetical protein